MPIRARHSDKKRWVLIYYFLTDLDSTIKQIGEKEGVSESMVSNLTDRYFDLKTNLRPEALRLGSAEAFSEHYKNIKL